jgi:predicted thioesterase
MSAEAEHTVTQQDTAIALGSGTVPVYGTPALVALMEQAAVTAVKDAMPDGSTSVGIRLDIRHQAATPVGLGVRAVATLTEIEGRILTFQLVAYDDVEQIGEGTHQRAVVDQARFLQKVTGKADSAS